MRSVIRSRPVDPLFTCLVVLLLGSMVWGAVSITAPANQARSHDLSDGPQALPEATWSLTSTESTGATVELSCGPFSHSTRTTVKTDCKLNLRVLGSAGSASWATLVTSDQTNVAAGDQTAAVSARSSGTGDGSLGLTVTLQSSDFSTLGAGDHVVTITGTISANF